MGYILDDMNNTQHTRELPSAAPQRRRVKVRARGVGDNYIDAGMHVPYEHEYTYKTFTPMFIFVLFLMACAYISVV